jgi:predicted GNAT superfamily acetyltransferase
VTLLDLTGASGEVLTDVLALNRGAEVETSPLDRPRLDAMLAASIFARAIADANGRVRALLLAFDQAAAYDGPNFLWFRDRLDRFVYVDRVVVAPKARGQGLARTLYAALFDHSTALGHDRIVCEVNLDPPNPGSDAFHAALGFAEVGRATARGKTVRYLSRSLA